MPAADFKVTQSGVASPFVVRSYLKCNVTGAANVTPFIPANRVTETVLAEAVLGTASINRSVTWTAQNFIPGLISIPAAMLVRSMPSTCP